jgi:hypothetical protein
MEEIKNINARINISTTLNTLLILQKTIESKNPKHEFLPMIKERIIELEETYAHFQTLSRDLSVSRQRNYDLELMVQQLTLELKAEKRLSNELMKGI